MSVNVERVIADVADPEVYFTTDRVRQWVCVRESELREMLAQIVEAKIPDREYDVPATHAFTVFAESAQRHCVTIDFIDERHDRQQADVEFWLDRKDTLPSPGGVLHVAVAGHKCWNSQLGVSLGDVKLMQQCPKCGHVYGASLDPSVWRRGSDERRPESKADGGVEADPTGGSVA